MFHFLTKLWPSFAPKSSPTRYLRWPSPPFNLGKRTSVFRTLDHVRVAQTDNCCKQGRLVSDSTSHIYLNSYFLRNKGRMHSKINFLLGRNHPPAFVEVIYREFSLSSTWSASGRGITENELKREIDDLTDKFMETRELLEDAVEAKGTVYFNDDLQDAKNSVRETLSQFEGLMSRLSEEQERNVRRTIGLKMEELRAQEAMIDETLKE